MGVVVVAAGRGERLGGVPKQYRELAGVPMLLRSIRPFASHPDVVHVSVVIAGSDAAAPPEWLETLAGIALTVVAGGAERSDSVAAGLAALPPACAVVLIHDAARPFVERSVIDEVIATARSGRGAIAAVRVSDTLKECIGESAGDARTVVRTVPRERMWRAQTPQGFPRALLESAYAAAARDGVRATDDAALVERTGADVRVVPDSPRNFKVTTPDDLVLAELWARHAT